MKKSFIFLVILLVSNQLFSQITLTRADFPTAGFECFYSVDTFSRSENKHLSDFADMNFSSMTVDLRDTMRFVEPSTLPNASEFPESNLAVIQSDAASFFQVTDAQAVNWGGTGSYEGVAQDVAFKFNNPLVMSWFPRTYQSQKTDTAATTVKMPMTGYPGVDSIRIDMALYSSSYIDSFGTFTYQGGNTASCLREKYKLTTEIHTFMYSFMGWVAYPDADILDSSVGYNFYSNQHKMYFATLDVDNDGYVTALSVQNYAQSSIANVKELKFSVNNPINSKLMISQNDFETANLRICDMSGRTVYTKKIDAGVTEIDVTGIKTGVYTITLSDKNNSSIGSKKIIIVH